MKAFVVKYKSLGLILGMILLGGAIYGFVMHKSSHDASYTLDSLDEMPTEDLYALFVDQGMKVHEDFESSFSQDQRLDIFMSQYTHLRLHGFARVLSFEGHMAMAKDIEDIVKNLTGKPIGP